MTPERSSRLVTRWARIYTRGLLPGAAERRTGEIAADLHDHVEHERAQGAGERRIAFGIVSRMLRGLPADVAWRKDHRPMSQTARSLSRVGIVSALILMIPLFGTLLGDGWNWGVFDFVFAAVLLVSAGFLIELAVRRPGRLGFRIAAAVLGVAAMVLGEADDAPGLVGFGLLVILGTIAGGPFPITAGSFLMLAAWTVAGFGLTYVAMTRRA